VKAGYPMGIDDFIEKLEEKFERLFKLRPKGRSKKKVDK